MTEQTAERCLRLDDATLAIAGDEQAFCRLALDCERTLYRVSRTVLRSDEDCADAVQEALLKAWRNLGTLRRPEYFRTWLVRIVLNECYTLCRRYRSTAPLEAADQALSAGAVYLAAPVDAVGAMDLRAAIFALPERLRVALVLVYVEGFTIEETARTLGLPQGTVKSRLSRARAKLAGHIAWED